MSKTLVTNQAGATKILAYLLRKRLAGPFTVWGQNGVEFDSVLVVVPDDEVNLADLEKKCRGSFTVGKV